MNTSRKLLSYACVINNKINLNNFIKKTFVKENNNKLIEYYENEDKIGYIYYNLKNGSINMFYIQEKYRYQGLGKQILNNVISEMKDSNIDTLWITNASKYNNFWSNVNNKSFTYKFPINVEPYLTGFYMKLNTTNN
jgi:hypothetical protein